MLNLVVLFKFEYYNFKRVFGDRGYTIVYCTRTSRTVVLYLLTKQEAKHLFAHVDIVDCLS
jgi:signal peptidase I